MQNHPGGDFKDRKVKFSGAMGRKPKDELPSKKNAQEIPNSEKMVRRVAK
jgi:hypothetical protein